MISVSTVLGQREYIFFFIFVIYFYKRSEMSNITSCLDHKFKWGHLGNAFIYVCFQRVTFFSNLFLLEVVFICFLLHYSMIWQPTFDHSHALPRPSHWRGFYQHLQLLASRSLALRNSKLTTQEIFAQVASDTCKHLHWQSKTNLQHQFHAVMAPGCFVPSAVQCHGASCSSLWLPIDLFLEDAMEGILVTPTCAIDTLTGMHFMWLFSVLIWVISWERRKNYVTRMQVCWNHSRHFTVQHGMTHSLAYG